MSLDGVIYLVRLIEMPLDEIGLSGKGRMNWPSFTDGQPTPPIDGVMILYDVTNRRSTLNFQNLLSESSILQLASDFSEVIQAFAGFACPLQG